MKKTGPIRRILLPVDGSQTSRQALEFAGRLGAALGKNLEGVTLLQVMEESYLSHIAATRDLRTDILTHSNTFKELKSRHRGEDIQPSLDKGKKLLKNLGIRARIETRIAEGEPAREIVRMAEAGRFSTIIMGRRGVSPAPAFYFGSVTDKVVKLVRRQDVYVVCKNLFRNDGPAAKMLVAVDGSPDSARAGEYAARLAAALNPSLSRITLLTVIPLANYEQTIKSRIAPDKKTWDLLGKARRAFRQVSIPDDVVTSMIRIGKPAEEILAEAGKARPQLVILGRAGKSRWQRLLLGSVSLAVLHRCQGSTVAIIRS
ncbi:MAG: universal stress protein [bacterium]|nr:universal stress protein [bacterium]